MKKFLTLLLTLALLVSLAGSAFADGAQYANTQAFLSEMDAMNVSYTIEGLQDTKEHISIQNKGDNFAYTIHIFFNEDNECVSFRVWDIIAFNDGNLTNVLRAVNKVNATYKYTRWFVEDDNTVTAGWDMVVRKDAKVGEIVKEAILRLVNILDEGYAIVSVYAK